MIEVLTKALRVQSVQAHEWAGVENQAPIFADLCGNCKLLGARCRSKSVSLILGTLARPLGKAPRRMYEDFPQRSDNAPHRDPTGQARDVHPGFAGTFF